MRRRPDRAIRATAVCGASTETPPADLFFAFSNAMLTLNSNRPIRSPEVAPPGGRGASCVESGDSVWAPANAAAATSSAEATSAAIEILRNGGNAVDAAVAAAWALAVCEPAESGLGGQTVMMIRFPDGKLTVVDGRSAAPRAASANTISRRQQDRGHRACTTPTTPSVLDYAQARYGRLSRHGAMSAAIGLASEGFRVTSRHRQALATLLRRRPHDEAIRRIFLKRADKRYRVGEVFRQPALAATLDRLSREGSADFYVGRLAKDVAEDMATHGGLLSAEDLARHERPREVEPLWGRYRGYRVATTPPPTGGLQLVQALHLLAQFEAPGIQTLTDDWLELIAATTAESLRQRERWSDDPRDVTPSYLAWMLSDERAAELAAAVRAPRAGEPALDHEGPGDTTHLCVSDSEGCVVSLTQSVQSVFGAKAVNEPLGFVYNNYLCTCLRSGPSYALGPNCTPKSNVAPTFVFRPEAAASDRARGAARSLRPWLGLGGAGSRRILSSVLQVLSHVVDRGASAPRAVAEPRVHGLSTGCVWIEAPAASAELKLRLAGRFPKVRLRSALSRHMGSVQAIEFRPDGTAEPAADPRRQGAATTLALLPPRTPQLVRSTEGTQG